MSDPAQAPPPEGWGGPPSVPGAAHPAVPGEGHYGAAPQGAWPARQDAWGQLGASGQRPGAPQPGPQPGPPLPGPPQAGPPQAGPPPGIPHGSRPHVEPHAAAAGPQDGARGAIWFALTTAIVVLLCLLGAFAIGLAGS